jgi:hypothetical protein
VKQQSIDVEQAAAKRVRIMRIARSRRRANRRRVSARKEQVVVRKSVAVRLATGRDKGAIGIDAGGQGSRLQPVIAPVKFALAFESVNVPVIPVI